MKTVFAATYELLQLAAAVAAESVHTSQCCAWRETTCIMFT